MPSVLRSAASLAAASVLALTPQVAASSGHLVARLDIYDPGNKTLQYEYPQYDQENPLRYIPSLALAVVGLVLYALVCFYLAFGLFKWGQKWMLTLIIGTGCYSFSLGCRIWFRQDTHATTTYIIFYLFNTLSPIAFLAADYILLGRLVRHLGMDKHLLIPAIRTTRIFVGSDIATFCIQAAGGGLATNRDPKINDTGSKIFFAGLVLQLVSFAMYTLIVLHFGWKMRKHEPELWRGTNDKQDKRWKLLWGATVWSCFFFLIRSFFRAIELSQGFHGHLSTHEVYIYTLDTLPLFLGVLAFIPFYPGRFLRPDTAGAHPYAYDDKGNLKQHATAPQEGVVGEDEKSGDGEMGFAEGEKRRRTWWGRRRA